MSPYNDKSFSHNNDLAVMTKLHNKTMPSLS